MDAVIPSQALLAANRRLQELRLSYHQNRPEQVAARPPAVWSCGSRHPLVTDGQQPTPTPEHQNPTVKLHSALALAMLRSGQAAAGRIWLLLRYLDKEGRGNLRIDVIRNQLSGHEAPLRVCGWRQLRNLLQKGRGIFWERDEETLWLRSPAKVAAALEAQRLRGQPVALPVAVLLGGMGQVRAHFYASFHSSRNRTGQIRSGFRRNPQFSSPISLSTLARITHVPQRTQRLYDRQAKVKRRGNIAVGDPLPGDPLPGDPISADPRSAATFQERSWHFGRAVFEFTDYTGKQGRAGNKYIAWRLPNSYEGPHQPSPKGRQEKINRQIDLVINRVQGNGLSTKLFHPNGLEAGKAFNRDSSSDVYWPQFQPGPADLEEQLWFHLAGN